MGVQEHDFNFQIVAHPTLLSSGNPGHQRKMDIFFSIPSAGITDETGIILLIAGFGGNAQSNVYKKMRRVFADTYNLVAVQCNYLGYEFMQTPKPADVQEMLAKSAIPLNAKIINVKASLSETIDNYVDMGPIQAMDCLSAVLATKAVLEDNQYYINWGRSIAYGHSHGAYLAHLCNLFAPGLFKLLIDNSAWLLPAYLFSARSVYYTAGDKTIQLIFDYLIEQNGIDDKNIYYLPYLYKKMETNCTFIIYQGVNDNLVDYHEKKQFADLLKTSKFHLIREEDVDGEVFRSTGHGLGSDHLKLFSLAYDSYDLDFPNSKQIVLDEVRFETKKAMYIIDYSKGMPIFKKN